MSSQKQAYLFVGDDEYPLNQAARQLVNALVPAAEQAFGLEVIEGRADSIDDALVVIKRCHEALVTPGFLMTGSKVIWWRGVSFLDAPSEKDETAPERSKGSDDDNDRVREALKGFAVALQSGLAGTTVLVVTAPKIDKRSTFYKLFSSQFEVREFFLPDKAYLVERMGREKINAAFRAMGVTIDPEALELFLTRVGADSRQIHMEVEKLALFLGERRRATVEDVQMVVSTTLTSVMWDLLDAVGERKLPLALGILRELLAGKENPIGIVVSLSSRMRDLVIYREALDKGWVRSKGTGAEWGGVPEDVMEVVAAALKRPPHTIHSFVVGKMVQQARGYPAPALRRNQRLLSDAYESLVNSSIPNQTVLELLLIRLMT